MENNYKKQEGHSVFQYNQMVKIPIIQETLLTDTVVADIEWLQQNITKRIY